MTLFTQDRENIYKDSTVCVGLGGEREREREIGKVDKTASSN